MSGNKETKGDEDDRFASRQNVYVVVTEGHGLGNDGHSFETEDDHGGGEGEPDGGPMDVQNEDGTDDDADKIYSEDGYHSVYSSESGDSSCSDVDGVESSEGPMYTMDLENPVIGLGKKFKDVAELRFCLRQYSTMSNFNYKT